MTLDSNEEPVNQLTAAVPEGGQAALQTALTWMSAPGRLEAINAGTARPLSDSSMPDSLGRALLDAGFVDWSADLAAAAAFGGAEPTNARATWLMAQLALELATRLADLNSFKAVETFEQLGALSHVDLVAALGHRPGGIGSSEVLVGALQSSLYAAWESRRFTRHREYSAAQAGLPLTTRRIWPSPHFSPVGHRWAHLLAATTCPAEYMAMLASLPIELQHAIESPVLSPDLRLVRSLVQGCPLVLSSEGRPLGPVFIFALLEAVAEELGSKRDAEGRGLPALLDILFTRDDGQWLARVWVQQIIWRDSERRAGRHDQEVESRHAARLALLERLSERIAPLGTAVFAWVESEEPLWRVDRVLTEACALVVQDQGKDALAVLEDAVHRELVSTTGRVRALGSHSFEAAIVAGAAKKLTSRTQWFRSFWLATYEHRERRSYPAHRDLDNPAYPALFWGLVTLLRDCPPEEVPGMWGELTAAAFETGLMDPNAWMPDGPLSQILRALVQSGAEFLKSGALDSASFAIFMRDHLEPTAVYAHFWSMLRARVPDDLVIKVGKEVGPGLKRALTEAVSQTPARRQIAIQPGRAGDLATFLEKL